MRIVLHAGLHKTGTTSVQSTWLKSFRAGTTSIRYPEPLAFGPGHAAIAWWLIDRRGAPGQPLPEVVADAAASGADVLLLSSEEFDRHGNGRLDRFQAAVGEHPVTLLLTLTPPRQRWPSAWQELVKHGFTQGQDEGRDTVAEFAKLRPHALTELLESFGVDDVRVRLVRPDPPETALAHDLLTLAGLDAELSAPECHVNGSIGLDEAHLLRALNELHPGGYTTGQGKALLTALEAHPGWRANVPWRKIEVDPVLLPYVVELADAEARTVQAFRSSGRVVIDDPHELLRDWSTIERSSHWGA